MRVAGESFLQLQHGSGGLWAALGAATEKEVGHPDLAAQIVPSDCLAAAFGQGKGGYFAQ